MLYPAQLYKEELKRKLISCWYKPEYDYYFCGEYSEFDVPDATICLRDFVHLDKNGEVDVLNNVNFYTGKTFETEFNQGKIPERAWSKLRQVSDELCKKHHLSVIESPEKSKGKSHYEWELDKQSLSWKAQLKQAIDEVIKVSEDFNDFLAKCAEFGILVDYNPDHKIDLKFMLAAQKERNPRARFTRAKTLGWFYESKQIARRIETYKYMTTHAPKVRLIPTTAERFQQSQGLQNWADRENMKVVSKALNEMTADNSTIEELESAAHRALAKFTVSSALVDSMKNKVLSGALINGIFLTLNLFMTIKNFI